MNFESYTVFLEQRFRRGRGVTGITNGFRVPTIEMVPKNQTGTGHSRTTGVSSTGVSSKEPDNIFGKLTEDNKDLCEDRRTTVSSQRLRPHVQR